jgi:hypothetical protein
MPDLDRSQEKMLFAWQHELQHQLAGEPSSWIPLLLLFLAYPARLYLRWAEWSGGLLMLSWILALLYCATGVSESFTTVSSERSDWLAQNAAYYYRFILIPTVIKQVVFTLPFFVVPQLRLPGREARILLVIAAFSMVDVALLSILPQRLLAAGI